MKPVPSPAELLQLAKDYMPPYTASKVLRTYRPAMLILREKGYSYAEIARWMSARLPSAVTRMQVYLVVKGGGS